MKVSIGPSTFGVTGITLLVKFSGAGLTGVYVFPSIVIGLESFLTGTNSLLLIVITGVTFCPTGTIGFVGSLKTGWNTLGITSTGMNVLFCNLNVVIWPSLVGAIEFDLLTLDGADLTGMNVLPSITTGLIGVPVIGTNCLPLTSITCFGAGVKLV